MEMECYRTLLPEPKEDSGRGLTRRVKQELCDMDESMPRATVAQPAAMQFKEEPRDHPANICSYILAPSFNAYPQIVYSPESPTERFEATCRCIIDTSTPDTLERDFYAWLNVSFGPYNAYVCLFRSSACVVFAL